MQIEIIGTNGVFETQVDADAQSWLTTKSSSIQSLIDLFNQQIQPNAGKFIVDVKRKKIFMVTGQESKEISTLDSKIDFERIESVMSYFKKNMNYKELLPNTPWEKIDSFRWKEDLTFDKFQKVYTALGSHEATALDIIELIEKEDKLASSMSKGFLQECWDWFQGESNQAAAVVKDPAYWAQVYANMQKLAPSDKLESVTEIFLKFRNMSQNPNDALLLEISNELVKKGLSPEQISRLNFLGFSPGQMLLLKNGEAEKIIQSDLKMAFMGDVNPLNEKQLLEIYFKAMETFDNKYKFDACMEGANLFPRLGERFLTQQIADDWQSYVVRRAGWSKGYVNTDQQLYGTFMSVIVEEASALLKKESINFAQFLDDLASARNAFAIVLYPNLERTRSLSSFGSCYPFSVGSIREPSNVFGYTTPCKGETYGGLGNRLRTLHSTMDGEFQKSGFRVFGTVGNERIPLSYVSISPDSVTVEHTSYPEWDKALKYVTGVLCPKLMKETDPDIITQQAGEIFWWICQAKPWLLGDPSIAEILVKSLMKAKGVPLTPWKENIVPWEEVMMTLDPESFGKKFRDLMS